MLGMKYTSTTTVLRSDTSTFFVIDSQKRFWVGTGLRRIRDTCSRLSISAEVVESLQHWPEGYSSDRILTIESKNFNCILSLALVFAPDAGEKHSLDICIANRSDQTCEPFEYTSPKLLGQWEHHSSFRILH